MLTITYDDRLRIFVCLELHRLMSDFDVTLVNDSMNEFYLKFKGPAESTFCFALHSLTSLSRDM